MIFTDFLTQDLRDKKFTLSGVKRDYHLYYKGKEIKVFDANTTPKTINEFATTWVKHHKDD